MIIVGLDWWRYKHDFVIMDMQGKIVERGAIKAMAPAFGGNLAVAGNFGAGGEVRT